jgi:hypothetical protein
MRPGVPNAKRPWELDEEKQLRQMVEAGKSVTLIALRLKRTEQAVRQRLYILNIPLRDKVGTNRAAMA